MGIIESARRRRSGHPWSSYHSAQQ